VIKVGKHNALSGNTASGRTGPAYDGEYYTPTLRFAMWHAFADTRGLRHPFVQPNYLAAPSRRRAPWDVPPPWGEGFVIPNRSPDPLVRRASRDHPFLIPPVLFGGKGTSHVGWDTGDLPSQGKKLRVSDAGGSRRSRRGGWWRPSSAFRSWRTTVRVAVEKAEARVHGQGRCPGCDVLKCIICIN
jgi:hypothetical protein